MSFWNTIRQTNNHCPCGRSWSRRSLAGLIGAGCVGPLLAAGAWAAPSPAGSPPSTEQVVKFHKPKPRARFAVGDRWRVRSSELPMQMPDPTWLPVQTWVFAITGTEQTKDGPRLIVTVTREGADKPSVKLQIDPATQAIVRAETQVPVQSGERTFVERPVDGEPFVSDVSPVPIALPIPLPGEKLPAARDSAAPKEEAPAAESRTASATEGPPLFSFGPRFTQRTEPVDAGVGRAKIESGMSALKERRSALEPAGIPRFQTTIEGAGQRIEQEWDDTTPWPLYTQTASSRSWLVDYQKGK